MLPVRLARAIQGIKMAMNNQMFAGVRVVELAQFVFVPAATAVLADLGAEVIHVEAITGDPYRTMQINDGRQTKSANLSMEQNNRGKKSVAINVKTKEGREILLQLIETADVFLTSVRPAALKRLSLGLEVIRARNPRIIYAHGNGLGFAGDEADRAGYDASCFWARGGFAYALTPAGHVPIRPRAALGDHAGAMNIAFGIAAALFNREKTGEAASIEVSLLSSAMWILSADVCLSQAVSEDVYNIAMSERLYAQKRAYKTLDGRYVQLMFLDPVRYWPSLCERVGRPDLISDLRFANAASRDLNGAELITELDDAFAMRTLGEWRAAFDGWDAPWEVVQTIKEVATDPQGIANHYQYPVKVADGTVIAVVAGPVSFNGSAVPVDPRCSPALGEHTAEILRDIGICDADIGAWFEREIIA
jgi:crotonobetainyl-CoA:carnitine CoA-transferase CaiB-like acyl-CoA transferase